MSGWAEVFMSQVLVFNILIKTCLDRKNNKHWLSKCKPITNIETLTEVCEELQCGRNNWFYFIESNCLVIVGTVSYHRCKINHFNSWDNSESPHHFVQQQQHQVIENLQFNLFNVPPSFSQLFFVAEVVCYVLRLEKLIIAMSWLLSLILYINSEF